MPRVDRGWLALDYPLVAEYGFERVAEALVSSGGVLVTSPSIVAVKTGIRTILVTLGVGAAVLPPGAVETGYPLARPEWVDGCVPREFVAPEPLDGPTVPAKPPYEARDARDPVALLINGLDVPGLLRQPRDHPPPLVVDSEGKIVVAYSGGIYYSAAEGELERVVNYIAGLYSGCRGR